MCVRSSEQCLARGKQMCTSAIIISYLIRSFPHVFSFARWRHLGSERFTNKTAPSLPVSWSPWLCRGMLPLPCRLAPLSLSHVLPHLAWFSCFQGWGPSNIRPGQHGSQARLSNDGNERKGNRHLWRAPCARLLPLCRWRTLGSETLYPLPKWEAGTVDIKT